MKKRSSILLEGLKAKTQQFKSELDDADLLNQYIGHPAPNKRRHRREYFPISECQNTALI